MNQFPQALSILVANYATGINNTGANLPLVSTTLEKLVAKFADGFVDIDGKICHQLRGTDS
jgi:hypothetical protein